ncbi:MAG TPA: ATP-binding protein [Acidimicrobiales bacterium]
MTDATDVALDELPVAVAVIGADRRVVAANRSAAALVGRALGDLVGARLDDLLAPIDGDEPGWLRAWHPSVALASVRGFPEHEACLRRPDGGIVRVLVAGRYRRDGGGRLEAVVVTARPMSGTASPTGAIRAGATPSGMEIVSTVSHELRSPLTSVKGYSSLLLHRWDRIPEEQKRSMLAQINHDADRVTRLITELLDISRLETGRLSLRRQDVDLTALAATVVDKLAFEHADLEVAIEFPADFPLVYADADKIEQVLTNLVENAAKYASPTGMRIVGSVGPGEVAVAVEDRGSGIPAADLPRVFTRFFRRDHGRPTGSGLGLWISRGLVEAHGGRLTATSIEGTGSIFRFTLPTDAFEQLHG